MAYSVEPRGAPNSLDYRLFFSKYDADSAHPVHGPRPGLTRGSGCPMQGPGQGPLPRNRHKFNFLIIPLKRGGVGVEQLSKKKKKS